MLGRLLLPYKALKRSFIHAFNCLKVLVTVYQFLKPFINIVLFHVLSGLIPLRLIRRYWVASTGVMVLTHCRK